MPLYPGMTPPSYPEYRLIMVWRADQNGNGIRITIERENQLLQSSFHPTLNLHEALETALESWFGLEDEQAPNADKTPVAHPSTPEDEKN